MSKIGENIKAFNQVKDEKKIIDEENYKELKDNKGKSTGEDSYEAPATDKQNEKIPLDNKENSPAEVIFKVPAAVEQNFTKKNSNPKKSIKKKPIKLKRKRKITPKRRKKRIRSKNKNKKIVAKKKNQKNFNDPNYIFFNKKENDGHMSISDQHLENKELEEPDKENEEDEKIKSDHDEYFILHQNDDNGEERSDSEDIDNAIKVEFNNKINDEEL